MTLTIDTSRESNILLKLHYLPNLCSLAWDLQANFHRAWKHGDDPDPVEVMKQFFENNGLPYEVVETFGE